MTFSVASFVGTGGNITLGIFEPNKQIYLAKSPERGLDPCICIHYSMVRRTTLFLQATNSQIDYAHTPKNQQHLSLRLTSLSNHPNAEYAGVSIFHFTNSNFEPQIREN